LGLLERADLNHCIPKRTIFCKVEETSLYIEANEVIYLFATSWWKSQMKSEELTVVHISKLNYRDIFSTRETQSCDLFWLEVPRKGSLCAETDTMMIHYNSVSELNLMLVSVIYLQVKRHSLNSVIQEKN
jgi:hypothetical protein